MAREERFFKYEGEMLERLREQATEQRKQVMENFNLLREMLAADWLPGGIEVHPNPVTGASQRSKHSRLYGVVLTDTETGKDPDRGVGADWIVEGYIDLDDEDGSRGRRYWRPKWNIKGIQPVKRLWKGIKIPSLGGMVLAEFGLGNEFVIRTERGRSYACHSVCFTRGDVVYFRVPVPTEQWDSKKAREIDGRLVEMKKSEFIAETEEA